MAEVQYESATCQYPGNPVPSVNEMNLDISDGEFMVLVGPSGSGKSTALRMLAGLEPVTKGRIRIGGRDVTGVASKDRDIAMVFQNYALYPHMSVAENMGFALKLKGTQKEEIDRKVAEAAKLLDLERYLERKPKALSGGQRQRVAMGRAIVRSPQVFLLDEPLSNLDAKLRVETRANIAELQARLETTTIYVTHDQVEAMTMGHRVAVLKDGVLQQVDTPRHLYANPCNTFVAEFIGSPSMNLRRGEVTDEGVRLDKMTIPVERDRLAALGGGREMIVGVRPEGATVTADVTGLTLTVKLVEELGADAFVYGDLSSDDGSEARVFVLRVDGHAAVPGIGEIVNVKFAADQLHLFDAQTSARIP